MNYKLSFAIGLVGCLLSISIVGAQDARSLHVNASKNSAAQGLRLPLGWSRTFANSDLKDGKIHLGIWVPSRYGGKLSISILAGQAQVENLRFYNDRRSYTCGDETGFDRVGYYEFDVLSSGGFSITNTFIEEGCSAVIPWNYWYYPLSSQQDKPHLWDVTGVDGTGMGPLKKFDAYFNSNAWSWESNHRKNDYNASDGHCLEGAIASSLIKQQATTALFSDEDLEGYSTAYFIPAKGTPVAGCPPSENGFDIGFYPQCDYAQKGNSDGRIDQYVDIFHRVLIRNLREGGSPTGKKWPFLIDLRTGGPTTSFNTACYKYKSVMFEDSDCLATDDKEKRRVIRVLTTINCNNNNIYPSPGNPETESSLPAVTRFMEYRLLYDEKRGEILGWPEVVGKCKQDWISCKDKEDGQVVALPLLIQQLDDPFAYWTAKKQGLNPAITFQRLNDLGLRSNDW